MEETDGCASARPFAAERAISRSIQTVVATCNPDALIVTDTGGRVVDWNPGATRTFGYEPEEASGRTLVELVVVPGRAEEHERLARETLARGSIRQETVTRRRDYSMIYVDVVTQSPVGEMPEGHILWCSRDVTLPKLARAASQLAARYGDLLESTPDGMLLVDETGHIVLANSNAETLFGYGKGELHGRAIQDLLPSRPRVGHPERPVDPGMPSVGAVDTGVERFGRRKTGSEFPVEVSLSPLRTEEGTVAIHAVRDVTDRVNAARKFRALLEAAPDAIVIADQAGRIVIANSQADALFGYTRDELIGQGVELLLPERFRSVHTAHREGYYHQPRVRAMGAGLELYARHKDGREFPVEISLSPITTEEGTLVSAAIRDITDRKEVEHRLQDQNEELARASAAKTDFLAGMSHELRTPLNAIIGFTGTLLMKLPGPLTEEQEKQLRTVQWAGQHLLALINDLLDVTRIESGQARIEPARLRCREVALEAVTQLRRQADSKNLELQIDLPADDVEITTDRRALRQILLNLLSNGVKYTDRGSVRLSLRQDLPQPGWVRFDIADTGVGIGPTDRERLFKAFSRLSATRDTRQGAGLGLYLSARLARLLGGQIDFVSTPGVGSTFTLALPGE